MHYVIHKRATQASKTIAAIERTTSKRPHASACMPRLRAVVPPLSAGSLAAVGTAEGSEDYRLFWAHEVRIVKCRKVDDGLLTKAQLCHIVESTYPE